MRSNGHVARPQAPPLPSITSQPMVVELRLGEDLAAALASLARLVAAPPAKPVPPLVPNPADQTYHLPDWSIVRWNGIPYKLTPKQRKVVALLWRAWEDGTRFVSEIRCLNAADSDQPKLGHLFKRSPAWGGLIVPGELHGGDFDTYCLTPLDIPHTQSPGGNQS